MEKVISLLFEIEEKANRIIELANEEKIRLYASLEKDLVQMEENIVAENTAKLSILQTQADQELSKEKQTLIFNCEKQLKNLDAQYDNYKEELVKKVFEDIIHS